MTELINAFTTTTQFGSNFEIDDKLIENLIEIQLIGKHTE
tara:strand:- start:690 stop:809 length:120 start_codon:yes stop_codon:yes gene_type:complete